MSETQEAENRCAWYRDGEDSDTFGTGCGHYFTLIDGTPAENDMLYCCYCGKPLEESISTDDEASHD